jgi:hypothetical protein
MKRMNEGYLGCRTEGLELFLKLKLFFVAYYTYQNKLKNDVE